ncbi:MAG TPA: hybrid sensor histidine kinase/response regulator [Bryobacteraceae bacterium]|jgi:DNA-binding response OmpR family regulator|nr:hybrid sensor histidine kinase/response regulator [Bryobacteraceae bacterium]
MFPAPPEIMVVDDQAPNVRLLEQMLGRKGYRVRTFLGGQPALVSARAAAPDLVLLDINMPGLDGYQTCKLFKQDPVLAEIPIIFLSAISQTSGKTEAFRCGGVDYIAKPFEFEEVYARVDTHLKISSLQNRLREHNLRLEAIVEERTRELARAHEQLSRLDHAKSDFLHMISHELRTPLNGLLGAAELILSEIHDDDEAAELSGMLGESRQRILSLVDSALLLTQIEIEGGRFQAADVNLSDVLETAAGRADPLARSRRVRIDTPPYSLGWTTGNREMLVRAWQALLETAARFAIAGDAVTVAAHELQEAVELAIDAPNGSIPESALPQFFHVFGIGEATTVAGSLGLDPAMAKRIFALWGSAVGVENSFPRGIRITVRCPSVHGTVQSNGQSKTARG